jgi:hypothetical protein
MKMFLFIKFFSKVTLENRNFRLLTSAFKEFDPKRITLVFTFYRQVKIKAGN